MPRSEAMCHMHICNLLRTNALMALVTQDKALQRFWVEVHRYHASAVDVLPKGIGQFWLLKSKLERLPFVVLDSLVKQLATMCYMKICNELRTNPPWLLSPRQKLCRDFGLRSNPSLLV